MDAEEKKVVARLRVLLGRCCGDTGDVITYAQGLLHRKNLGRLGYIPGELRYISRAGESVKIAEIRLTDADLRKIEKEC